MPLCILFADDQIQEAHFTPYNMPSIMAVYPTVTTTLSDVSMTDCVLHFLASLGCTMFSVDSGNCILTNMTSGPAADVTRYNKWYIRQ
jgi:hypothetical protein